MHTLLRENVDGCHIDFGIEPHEEARLPFLQRICAGEKVSVVCFEDEAQGKKWAHVYVQDDLEHHAADIFVGVIGRDDRWITLDEIGRALARWSERDVAAFTIDWWNGVPRDE